MQSTDLAVILKLLWLYSDCWWKNTNDNLTYNFSVQQEKISPQVSEGGIFLFLP